MRSTFRSRAYQIPCIPTSTDPPSDTMDLIDDDEMSPTPYDRRQSLPRSSYLQTPTRYARGRSVSSHSTTSTESGPQPSPGWFYNTSFNSFGGSKSLVNINKDTRERESVEEDDGSPRSGRSTTRSTLRYTNSLKSDVTPMVIATKRIPIATFGGALETGESWTGEATVVHVVQPVVNHRNAVFLCSTKESALIDDDSEDEEFSELLSTDERQPPGRRPVPPSGASIAGSQRRIGPVNRQMSDVSAISPRRMMKGRSPSAPSLGGRKLKRMDSTATTISQTSNNTSTSSIRGAVNAHAGEEKVPPRLPKSLNQSQMQRYLNKGKEDSSFSYNSSTQPDGFSIRSTESRISFNASQSSESPSSSSMGVRPESVVSRQSRVVTVKPKASVSSLGERRSASSVPTTNRPDSEVGEKKEEPNELPSFVHSLVWKLTDSIFIGNETVSTNAHVLCRLKIGATIELYDGPDLEDNKRTFDNTCFCEKRSHARYSFKLRVPDNEHDAHMMSAKHKANGEPFSLSDMIRVFCEVVDEQLKAKLRILVFSRRGRNRAPAFCVGYLMKLNNINRRTAQQIVETQMDTMRPKIQIEQYLIRALLQWQLKLNVAMEKEKAKKEAEKADSAPTRVEDSMKEEPGALYKSTKELFSSKTITENSTVRRSSMEKIPPKQAW